MLQKMRNLMKIDMVDSPTDICFSTLSQAFGIRGVGPSTQRTQGTQGSRVGLRYLLRLKSTLDVNFNASTFGHTCEHRQTGVYLRLAMLRKLRGKKVLLHNVWPSNVECFLKHFAGKQILQQEKISSGYPIG